MSRRLIVIVLAVTAFVVVSLLLARWLTTENRERDAVYALLRDQARGDATAMLARLDGCAADARCHATVERDAARLRRDGEVKILAYDSDTAYALGSKTGVTRVAWTVVDHGLPVVQCVRVRREGSILTGRAITLLSLSAPIDRTGSC